QRLQLLQVGQRRHRLLERRARRRQHVAPRLVGGALQRVERGVGLAQRRRQLRGGLLSVPEQRRERGAGVVREQVVAAVEERRRAFEQAGQLRDQLGQRGRELVDRVRLRRDELPRPQRRALRPVALELDGDLAGDEQPVEARARDVLDLGARRI